MCQNMHHLILNLERRPDRKRFMEAKLATVGITDYEFVTAVDQRDVSHLLDTYPKFKRGPACGLAVYMSMLKMLRHAKQLGLERFVYLEDDVYFRKDYAYWWERHTADINSADLLYLGHQARNAAHLAAACRSSNVSRVYKATPTIWGNYGMVVSRHFVDVFLATKDMSTKVWLNDYECNDALLREQCHIAVMYPKIVIPDVRDSDNTANRRQDFDKMLALDFRVRLSDYADVGRFSEFIDQNNTGS